MITIRRTNCDFDNELMTEMGYEIIAIEDHHWDDGHIESEIIWERNENPIQDSEVPF